MRVYGAEAVRQLALDASHSFDSGAAALRRETREGVSQGLFGRYMDYNNFNREIVGKSKLDFGDGLVGVRELAFV